MKYERDQKGGVYVEVRNNNIDQALRKFKKKVAGERVLQDLAKHEYYEKPSVERKRKKAQARKRWLKKRRELSEKYGMQV